MYVQLDDGSRVVGIRTEAPPEVDAGLWAEVQAELGDDFNDYVVADGKVLYAPLPPPLQPATPERVLSALFEAKPEMLDAVPSDLIDGMAQWFDGWSGDGEEYGPGKLLNRDGVLYRVLQAHTSQPDWEPGSAPSLFARALADPSGTVLPWEQPGSENGYMRGDRVTFGGKTWESLIDNNVWSPDGYPAGWREN